MAEAKKILQDLKDDGHRMTRVRQGVVEVLARAHAPKSAAELIAALEKRDVAVNKTTVYRELEFLLARRVIREVDLMEGHKRYELLGEGGHHHHMICLKCRTIQCIEMENDLDALERDILATHNFKVENHTLEFFGVCGKCRGTGAPQAAR